MPTRSEVAAAPWFDPPLFGSPALVVFDTLRLIVIVASLALIYLGVRAVFVAKTPAARLMLASYMVAVTMTMEVQVERLGEPLSWRFGLALIATVVGLYGAYRFLYRGESATFIVVPRARDAQDGPDG